ncbi:hypothetical protein [Sediminibacterium soli]|uniref:hypothetical protein n=1 Tax=Sediminibacterium soli TaxID=2698829 RepID=UPI00137AFB1F|nr:hypothetical protein [Sediminibacterium soli]NCI48150.1 hypothetical protein [Sediminibacterium soli]
MERVGTLINKLKEQFDGHADTASLAMTAQLLLAELQQKKDTGMVTRKVSVVMPQVVAHRETEETPPVKTEAVTPWMFDTQHAEIPTLAHQTVTEAAPEIRETVQVVLKEVNHLLAVESESLNERFREERKEVMSALQDSPVRDLKKAIGINDRYLFLNDLFRGDESVYERSIKTINAFNIYPEAQYWIQRELKIKLSWPDNSETVRLFDQLIRRRFA